VEAIFNLGLVNKQLGIMAEALQAFEKLHTLVPASPEVMFQIATLHETLGNYAMATKYFNYLITRVPSDPSALLRLGQIFAKDSDDTQAFHYHSESYRYYPVSLDVRIFAALFVTRTVWGPHSLTFLTPTPLLPTGHLVAGRVVCEERDVREGDRVL